MSSKQNKNIEWYYAHEADLTIGEAKISKTAKIILYCLVIVLIAAAGFGIYFRNQIYDYIVNPTIIMSQNEVTISINGDFDPGKYVIIDDSHIQEVIYPDLELIDFSSEGEHELIYQDRNSMHENTHTLLLKIIDDEPPTIELTTTLLILTRGEDTKNFNPLTYVKDYYDNYTPKENLVLDYTKNLNWSNDVIQVNYVVRDENGLESFATLQIVLSDATPHEHKWDDGKVTTEATEEHPGVKTFTCEECGETKTEVIPQLEPQNTETDPSKPDDSTQSDQPIDPTNPPHNHSWDSGTVTTQPTCTSKGVRTYTCSCGQTKTESIAALGHSWQLINTVEAQVGVAGYKEYKCSRCGETYRETIPAKPKPADPYINGVHDVTVKVGTDFTTFVQQLTTGVQGSGYVTVNYSQVNLTKPGQYTVTFSSDDGVTKTCTVTVTE